MFLLSYHAFLRIGEVTVRIAADQSRVIQRNQIKISKSRDNLVSLELTMYEYKHSDLIPKTLVIPSQVDSRFCPVKSLQEYLNIGNVILGPLFQFPDGAAVSRSFFTKSLRSILQFNHFNPDVYQTHSFRIGAASDTAARGVPMITIQHMGRWKSNALKNYIRMHQFHV